MIVDLVGRRFGRLVVTKRAPNKKYTDCTRARWACRCDCGRATTVFTTNLTSRQTTSCGCFRREQVAKSHTTHGDCRGGHPTTERYAWASMIQRCHNQRNHAYKNYGGRGITVYSRWRRSYKVFLGHVGRRPSSRHSLDRRDNSNGYYPSNVRWATKQEQARNRRGLRLVTAFGITQCVAAWHEMTGVNQITINKRLGRKWPPEKAVSLPPDRNMRLCRR